MSNDQTLRDTFAAAAMAVLDEIDRALRERARNGAVEGREMVTDHDAAPAAKAEVATGTGHTTREPVAWLVLDATLEPFSVHRDKAQAICDSNAFNGMIFPLYRDPPCQDFLRKNLTLTDAEREVLNRAASHWMHLHPGVAWEGDLGDAMAAAVAEITSLREEVAKLRMTDSEREAMEKFAFDRPMDRATAAQTAATLRNLLARLGGAS